jgi:transposase-like protein
MAERGLLVDHTSIWRWTQTYGPEVYRRLRGAVSRKSSTWLLFGQRTRRYCNNRVESDHRHVKRRLRSHAGAADQGYGVGGDSGDRGSADDSQRPGTRDHPAVG